MSTASSTDQFLRILTNPLKFRLYLLSKIPSAFFSGIAIREADAAHCIVSVPFKRFTQNPFRSTYFACLSMAAEMSTGALAMAHSYRHEPAISMLVVSMEANYYKKATGPTFFRCDDGASIGAIIREAASTGEARTVRVRSVGASKTGEEIADFFVTWSFKARSPRT